MPRPFRRLIARRSDGPRRRGAGAFPWVEHAAANAIVGGSLACGLGRAFALDTSGPVVGAVAGLVGLAWLALGRADEGRATDLWDPWIDEPEDAPTEEPPPEVVAEPIRVRPRVVSESGESVPLEHEIGPILASHDQGVLRLTGADGSGKTTAIDYLSRILPPHLGVTCLDAPEPQALREAASRGVAVFTACRSGLISLMEWKLAPWGRDEWIEYLVAGAADRCASVMARLARRGDETALLGGTPELWATVLDLMAADDSIEGPRQALRIELARRLADGDFCRLVETDCLQAVVVFQHPTMGVELLRRRDPDQIVFRLARHRPVQLLLSADRVADDLARGEVAEFFAHRFPGDLITETVLRIAGRPKALEHLMELASGPDMTMHPTAASLLHALGTGWRPARPSPRLEGAYLEGASWPSIVLSDAEMRGVDPSLANLWGARLDRALLGDARLYAADLRTASLRGAHLEGANLRLARLAAAHAEGALFETAQLNAADLEAAILDRAILRGADLRDARLAGASLIGADLARADIAGADFGRADLSGAVLSEIKLSTARIAGARFAGANLLRGDLEGMELPNADFAGADLSEALLTGSRMPGANFCRARLSHAGLAEVEWERVNLRHADLREAAFHLGSSRSGMVGSPIACEGSRTGFYTDDFDEQDFKSPEEIRKANLAGADLRGANIEGVDFYLVDLRNARVDADQIPHLRSCGAILESRV